MGKKTILFIISFLCFGIIRSQTPTFSWAKQIGGTGSPYNSITVDASGNVYTTGTFGGVIDFDPGPGTYTMSGGPGASMYICKLDAAGNFVWAKQMAKGPSNTASAQGMGIEVDAGGNIYTTGTFYSICDFDPGPGIYNLSAYNVDDIFISKLDINGNFVWAKSVGSIGWDRPHGMALDKFANVHITGEFYFTTDFDPSASSSYTLTAPGNTPDCFVLKLDSAGNFMWASKLGGAGGSLGDIGNEIAVDPMGNVITVGVFDTIADFAPGPLTYTIAAKNGQDIFISKLDVNGAFVWATSIGGNTTANEYCSAVTTDALGNVYTAGNFFGTTDFDPGSGTYTLTTPGSSGSGYFNKLDPLGNLIWVKQIDCGPRFISLDPAGNVCSSGTFGTNTDFDPGPGTFTIAGFGGACVNQLDANGNFVWAGKIGDYNYACGFEIVSDVSGNLYTTGYFYGTHDFDPGPGTFTMTSIAGYDSFIHKLGNSITTSVQSGNVENTACLVYPNPNNGSFTLRTKGEIKNSEIQILNALGQIIFSQKIEGQTNSIQCSGLSQGLYQFILFENKIKIAQGKMVVE